MPGKEERDESDLDELFEELQEIVSAIVRRLSFETHKNGHPFVYGLQIKVGSNGEPHVQEFGDLLPSAENLDGKREPLADISETSDEISVTLEIPGVTEDQIRSRYEDRKLIVSVETDAVEYYKELELDVEVDPESMRMTYVNGVLDVVLKKQGQESREGSDSIYRPGRGDVRR